MKKGFLVFQMSIDSFQSSVRGGFYPVPSEMETDTDSRIYEEVQQNQNGKPYYLLF